MKRLKKKISERNKLPFLGRLRHDVLHNFTSRKIVGLMVMAGLAIGGIVLATQLVSPSTTASTDYNIILRQTSSGSVYYTVKGKHIKSIRYYLSTTRVSATTEAAKNSYCRRKTNYAHIFTATLFQMMSTKSGDKTIPPSKHRGSPFMCFKVEYTVPRANPRSSSYIRTIYKGIHLDFNRPVIKVAKAGQKLTLSTAKRVYWKLQSYTISPYRSCINNQKHTVPSRGSFSNTKEIQMASYRGKYLCIAVKDSLGNTGSKIYHVPSSGSTSSPPTVAPAISVRQTANRGVVSFTVSGSNLQSIHYHLSSTAVADVLTGEALCRTKSYIKYWSQLTPKVTKKTGSITVPSSKRKVGMYICLKAAYSVPPGQGRPSGSTGTTEYKWYILDFGIPIVTFLMSNNGLTLTASSSKDVYWNTSPYNNAADAKTRCTPKSFGITPHHSFTRKLSISIKTSSRDYRGKYLCVQVKDAKGNLGSAIYSIPSAPQPPDEDCLDGHEQLSNGDCVPECPSGKERVNGACVPKCRVNETRNPAGRCIPKECPSGKERVNGACVPKCRVNETRNPAGRCIPKECPSGKERVNGACVPKCRVNETRNPAGRCIPKECPSGKERVNGACVPKCRVNETRNPAGRCIPKECPSGKERVNGACVPKCRVNETRNPAGRCVPKECPSGKERVNGACVPKCRVNETRNPAGRCVPKECPSGKERVNGACVPKCRVNETRNPAGRCVPKECPSGKERVNGACVPKCRVNETRNPAGRCIPKECPSGKERVNGACVPKCRVNETRNPAGRCIPKECPSGKERVNGACVPKCRVNETRNPAGRCIPKECPSGKERVNGACVEM